MTRRADTSTSKSNTDSIVIGRSLEQRTSVKEDVGNEDFSSFSSLCRESLAFESLFLYQSLACIDISLSARQNQGFMLAHNFSL